MIRRLSIIALVCAVIYGGVAKAWDIGTTYWGVCFTNAPALPTAIPITATPGSVSFYDTISTRRLILPCYYAWLDGYDTRAVVAADAMPPYRPKAYRRLSYYSGTEGVGSFLSRKETLRNARITPWWSGDNGTLWSSEISDWESYILEGQVYADFDWTKNPIGLIYDADDNPPVEIHTQFCFNYSQLWPNDYYPLQPNYGNRANNSFQRMLYTCDFGLEPGYGVRPEIRNYFNCSTLSRSTKYNTPFDEIIHSSFGPDYYAEQITNNTHRLSLETLAAANQALSLYTRSYSNSYPTWHLTRKVVGHAHTEYEAEGELSVNMDFDYMTGECSGTASVSSMGSATLVTNYINKTEYDNTLRAPTACYARIDEPGTSFSPIVLSLGGSGWLTNGCATVELDTISDVLDQIYAGEPILVEINGMVIDWWGMKAIVVGAKPAESGSMIDHPYPIPFTGSAHVDSATLHVHLEGYYYYQTALNAGTAYYRTVYPRVLNEYIDNEKWYFFSSFCCSTNYSNATELDELRQFIYDSEDEPKNWGYKCTRYSSDGPFAPYSFHPAYCQELNTLRDKCIEFTGETFYQNPALYMGLTPASVSSYFSGPYEFEAGISYKGNAATNILSKVDGHYVFGESATEVTVGMAHPAIGVKRKGDPLTLPPGRAIDTYMGDVTEVNWLFPQLKEQ